MWNDELSVRFYTKIQKTFLYWPHAHYKWIWHTGVQLEFPWADSRGRYRRLFFFKPNFKQNHYWKKKSFETPGTRECEEKQTNKKKKIGGFGKTANLTNTGKKRLAENVRLWKPPGLEENRYSLLHGEREMFADKVSCRVSPDAESDELRSCRRRFQSLQKSPHWWTGMSRF